MTTNKKHSFKAVLALSLAALIASTAFLTGCGSEEETESAEKETSIVTETQIVTRIVDGVYTDENGNPIKDENGQPVTAPSGTPDTKSETKESGGNDAQGSAADNGSSGGSQSSAADKGGSGGAQSSAGNNGGNNGGNGGGSQSSAADKSSSSGGNSGGESAGSGKLKVGSKTYNVGDTFTCTYTLTCKKLMSNFQAMVNYNGKCLKATNAYMDGPAKSGSVINYDLDSKIKFNGINLNGYNYTKGANFLVVEYKVLAGGTATPEFVWQIATDIKDNALVTNGKPDSSISLSASFS